MNIDEEIEKAKDFCNIKILYGRELCLLEEQLISYQSAIETLLTAYEKEKEKNKELESDIQQKNFEIKCLNSDIKNMYCEEGVIAILEDNFDLSREEAIQILEEE